MESSSFESAWLLASDIASDTASPRERGSGLELRSSDDSAAKAEKPEGGTHSAGPSVCLTGEGGMPAALSVGGGRWLCC